MVRFFDHHNFTVDAVVASLKSDAEKPLRAVVDTGSVPCFIRWKDIPKNCHVSDFRKMSLELSANGEGIVLDGSVEVVVKVKNLVVKQSTIVSEILAVPMVFWTSFINNHVGTISSKGKVITLNDSYQEPIVSEIFRKEVVQCA